jgi:hypothetical protein
MIVDCMTCPVRGQRCDDCAITVLRPPGWAEHLASAELQLSTELGSTGLQLDAAENRVVSMFVSAGLFSAGAVARLRARRESVQHWDSVHDVG